MDKRTILIATMGTLLVVMAWSQERATATAEQIKSYVERYDGGRCFFIRVLSASDGRAVIEGRGASLAAFHELDSAIKRDLGFEAQIAVRLVNESECASVDQLKR